MKKKNLPIKHDTGPQGKTPSEINDSEEKNISAARATLKSNNSFAFFVNRMHTEQRSFLVRKKRESEVEVVGYPEEITEDATSDNNMDRLAAESKWLDCCLREYIDRKAKCGSRLKWLVRTIVVFLIVASALSALWPIWEVLIDVEAEAHLKVLGVAPGAPPQEIKRAYREAVKRWHPDRNPNCDSCRAQMMKIQHAHDVLLARGDQQFELANRYREELVQLRSLVFFRLYSMAFNAAQELYYLTRCVVSGHAGASGADYSWPLQVVCRVLTMGLFTLYEVFYISGFGVVVIIQVFYYCVSATKSSVQEREMSGMIRRSYIDLYQEAFLFAFVPALIYGLQSFASPLSVEVSDKLECLFQGAFGFSYVLAHLYRMTPNLYDNVAMKKCSIPITYIKMPEGKVSLQNFFFAELGFLFDDLFAFTCRVPSVFRLVVIFVHVVFLCEFAWLPWDPPILGKLGRLQQSSSKKRNESEALKKQKDLATKEQRQKDPSLFLTTEEVPLLADLDSETLSWLDVVSTKYKSHMNVAAAAFLRQKPGSFAFDLVPTASLKEIAFVAIGHDPRSGGQKAEILFRIKDEYSSRLLGLQRGPWGCISSEAQENNNPDAIARRYALELKDVVSYTPSSLWSFRVKSISTGSYCARFITHAIAAFSLCLIIFAVVPSPEEHVRRSTFLSPLQQPLRDSRWTFLPVGHVLQRNGAGLATFFGYTFSCIDLWDALRQHSLRDE